MTVKNSQDEVSKVPSFSFITNPADFSRVVGEVFQNGL